jgi:uncharacterized protein YqeY
MPMTTVLLKQRIQDDMKSAMKAGEKVRLGVIRLILAAIKQIEVDQRIVLDDAQVTAVLDKMLKQRRDSITQYAAAGRTDLADVESVELGIIQEYMPQALTDAEVEALVEQAVAETGAASIAAMGKVMALLKPKLQGRADIGAVSALIKARLG